MLNVKALKVFTVGLFVAAAAYLYLSNLREAMPYSSDESRAYIKKRKTGKADHSPNSADSYVLYNERLQKSPQGVWTLVSVLSNRGAKQCQP